SIAGIGLLVARLGAVAVRVGPRARVAGVHAAASIEAGVRAVAEDAVVARAPRRVSVGAPGCGIAARLGTGAITVRAGARVERVGGAVAARAGIGSVAVQAVVAHRAVRIGCSARRFLFVAALGTVAVAVGTRARVARVHAAEAGVAAVGAVAEHSV